MKSADSSSPRPAAVQHPWQVTLSVEHCHARRWPNSKRKRGISLKDPAFSHEVGRQQLATPRGPRSRLAAVMQWAGTSLPHPAWIQRIQAMKLAGSSSPRPAVVPASTDSMIARQKLPRSALANSKCERGTSLAHSHDQTRTFHAYQIQS